MPPVTAVSAEHSRPSPKAEAALAAAVEASPSAFLGTIAADVPGSAAAAAAAASAAATPDVLEVPMLLQGQSYDTTVVIGVAQDRLQAPTVASVPGAAEIDAAPADGDVSTSSVTVATALEGAFLQQGKSTDTAGAIGVTQGGTKTSTVAVPGAAVIHVDMASATAATAVSVVAQGCLQTPASASCSADDDASTASATSATAFEGAELQRGQSSDTATVFVVAAGCLQTPAVVAATAAATPADGNAATASGAAAALEGGMLLQGQSSGNAVAIGVAQGRLQTPTVAVVLGAPAPAKGDAATASATAAAMLEEAELQRDQPSGKAAARVVAQEGSQTPAVMRRRDSAHNLTRPAG